MRKSPDTSISSFVNKKFVPSLIEFVKRNMESEEQNIQRSIKALQTIPLSYSKTQKEETVASQSRAIRRYEDRKSYYYKKIQALKSLDPSVFEDLLEKNDKYDGYYVDDQGRLNLYTKILKDGSKNIGRFRICISDNQSVSAREYWVMNLDYRYNNLHHWAIDNMRCCTGEWEIDFQRVMQEGNIPEFFNLMIYYITLSPETHTYTTKDNWYSGKRKIPSAKSKKLRTMNIFDIEESDEEYDEDNEDGEENIWV